MSYYQVTHLGLYDAANNGTAASDKLTEGTSVTSEVGRCH